MQVAVVCTGVEEDDANEQQDFLFTFGMCSVKEVHFLAGPIPLVTFRFEVAVRVS